MKLTQSKEDYLEAIYLIKKEKDSVKVKDIASNLNISLPSVTEVIRKLADKNLVRFERYGPIELTLKGKYIAKNIYEKHKLITKFFVRLGVDEETALHDACLAEHALSKKTLNKLKIFLKDKERI